MVESFRLHQKRQQYFEPSIIVSETLRKKEEEVKPPVYKCKSCNNCVDKRCSVFKRPVEPNYNRCFNHTFYNPNSAVYTIPSEVTPYEEEQEKEVKVA